MKRRFITLLAVAVSSMIFLATGVLIAADKQEVPDEITIQNKGYKRDKKGPVKFSHKKHHDEYKVTCAECHHLYKDGKNVWKEGDHVNKCSKCHDPKKKNKKTKAMKLQNAYHKDCKTCHKALAKEGKKTGPFKKCNQCHAKKKKKK